MFKFLIGLIAKGLKFVWHVVLAVVGLAVASYVIYQAHFAYSKYLYDVEGGIFVVDDITDPPLSQVYRSKHGPITTKWRRIGNETSATASLDEGDRIAIWRAFRKFPTLKQCLTEDGQIQGDFNQFNWGALRTNEQAKLCLFHIGNALNLDADKISEWLNGQGFEESVYELHSDQIRVSGRWSDKSKNSPFPIFSTMKRSEFGPSAWINGYWRKSPGIQISINTEKNYIQEISISYPGK